MQRELENSDGGNFSDWLATTYPKNWQRLSLCFQPLPYTLQHAVGWRLAIDAIARELEGIDLCDVLPSHIHRAVLSRKLSYIGGRLCAERGLIELGYPHILLKSGTLGAPVWPHGVIGSITHTHQQVYALVGLPITRQAVGIDCEPVISTEQASAVIELCCNADERRRWFTEQPDTLRATLLFSAKEAAYKAIAVQVGRVVDFTEFEVIQIDEQQQTLLLQACDLNGWAWHQQRFQIQFQLELMPDNQTVVHTFVAC